MSGKYNYDQPASAGYPQSYVQPQPQPGYNQPGYQTYPSPPNPSTQYQTQQNFYPPAPSPTKPEPPLQNTMAQPVQPQSGHHARHGMMQETDDELTEDELATYENGIINWEKAKSWRWWFRKEWIVWYLVLIVLIVLVALMAFYHTQIINWLTPVVRRLQTLNAGWLIPVAVLFVISFPPLFGQEIVMVLVGVVWGLGVGFAIVAVGTLLGEIANYFLFKYWCRERAYRLTRKNFAYACLSQAIMDGGFFMAWIVRLSAVPTHFTTAVMAVCGMTFLNFMLAAIFSLPKQLIAVYVGVVLGETSPTTNSKTISDSVFGVTAAVTILCLWFIYKRMMASRKKVLLEMRKDLEGKNVTTHAPANGFVEAEQREEGDGRRSFRHPFNGPPAVHTR